MQCLANDLIGDMRPIESAGIDVVDAHIYRIAQQGDRCCLILWRAENAGAGQLHCAIADAPDGTGAKPVRTGARQRSVGMAPVVSPWEVWSTDRRQESCRRRRIVRQYALYCTHRP